MKPTDVQAVRRRLHMTCEEFARAMGVHKRTVIKWEQGERQPSGPAVKLMLTLGKQKSPGKS